MTNEEAIERLRRVKELKVFGTSYMPALDLAISALSRDRWISVEERLPEKDGAYLVAYPLFSITTLMRVAYFTTNLNGTDRYSFPGKANKRPGFYRSDSEYGDIEIDDVTHWMPLPEPPKEET